MEIIKSIRRGNFYVDWTFKIDEILMSFPRGFFYAVSMSNRGNCSTHCFLSIVFEHFLLWQPILSLSGIVLGQCNFKDIDAITDIGTIRTISFGNFAIMQIIMNKSVFFLDCTKL